MKLEYISTKLNHLRRDAAELMHQLSKLEKENPELCEFIDELSDAETALESSAEILWELQRKDDK